jgi:hypothetical protein
MVAVALTDGLANRMFQYAFGLSLKRQGLKVLYDKCHYRKKVDQTWEFVELNDAFPNIDIEYIKPWLFFLTFPGHIKGGSLFIKLFRFLGVESVFVEPSLEYIPNIKKRIRCRTLFYGHWQSERYFDKCMDAVRKQFVFLPFSEEKNIICSKKMSKEESVAIHVRKGDDYSRWISTHGICERDYYLRAVSYIKKNVNNPVFYIFTDNPQWVKDNLTDIDYNLVDWNPVKGKFNFRDMQLMASAKHNIIANSTYSWWGAWLNNNPNKIVIAPERWVNGSEPSLVDNSIIPDRWIKM